MTHPSFQIQRATWEDREAIARFNQEMALETEDLQLPWDLVLSGVSRMLQDPQRGFYMLAKQHDQIIGQLAITTEWSDWRNANFWWIQSVYVRPQNRRQRVYSSLHQHIKTIAQNDPDVCGLRLYLEQDNQIAASVYRSLGMKASYYRFMEDAFLLSSTHDPS